MIGGVLLWFFSPGMHQLGPFYHFDIQRVGYVIEEDTDVVIGQTDVKIQGTACRIGGQFNGVIDVAEYRNTEPGIYDSLGTIFVRQGSVSLSHLQAYFSETSPLPGDDGGFGGICDIKYYAYFYGGRQDVIQIQIMSGVGEPNYLVVCCDSPEDALKYRDDPFAE